MNVSFSTLNQVLPLVTKVKKPVLLRGVHGIGKSELVYQFANLIEYPVVERRASQMTEGDLLGLPKIDGNMTSWLPPDWLKTACDEAVVLFIDEIDRATPEVRQGFFELTDSRKIAGNVLHPDTLIFAAVNGGTYGSQYSVGDMDPAELDRWTVFDVAPTTEEWLEWGLKDNNIHPIIVDFIRTNPTFLEHSEKLNFEPNTVYPSRRSWKRLNDCLVVNNVLKEDFYGKPFDNVVLSVVSGFVGMTAAVALSNFAHEHEKSVTVDDIIKHGKIELTKEFNFKQHHTLVTKMNQEKMWDKKLSKKEMNNFVDYSVTLPPEIFMLIFAHIEKGTAKNENLLSFHKNEKSFKYLLSIIENKDENKAFEKQEELGKSDEK